MLKARDCLTQEEVRRCSERICAVIAETEAYEKAGNICLYMPVRNEVEVTLMEKQARKDGKTLWIPKVEGEILTFYRWDEDMEMTTGDLWHKRTGRIGGAAVDSVDGANAGLGDNAGDGIL